MVVSRDIVGDFCISCWVELADKNWRPSNKKINHKKCNSCYDTRQPKTAPPTFIQLKNKICTECKIPLDNKNWPLFLHKNNYYICNTCLSINRSNTRYDKKINIIKYYGGKCQCCGEDRPSMLNIDHINNNGNKHRQEIGPDIYQWLETNNYPKGFRCLCWSCNCSLGHMGYCPHKPETIKKISEPSILYKNNRNNKEYFCVYCAILLEDNNWYISSKKKHFYSCIDCSREVSCLNKQKVKIDVINAYGNHKCQCCGEEHIEFLTIDHIYEDAGDHLTKLNVNNSGSGFYAALKKAGYPDKDRLRVLCFNCNCARSICGNGTCPHEEERQHKAFLTNSHSFLTRAATND